MYLKIKPHEILKYLGFDIPEEGIEANENDMLMAFLVSVLLTE